MVHTDPPHPEPHAASTDRTLVEAMNAGDEAAFAQLYSRHRDWVVRLAYRFTRNEQDALDVLQEVFAAAGIIAHTKLGGLQKKGVARWIM